MLVFRNMCAGDRDFRGATMARERFFPPTAPSAPSRLAQAASPSRKLSISASSRQRSFAFISHPDAGKTTLTERLLLVGGVIQFAGEVRAKANRRQTRSGLMGVAQRHQLTGGKAVLRSSSRREGFAARSLRRARPDKRSSSCREHGGELPLSGSDR